MEWYWWVLILLGLFVLGGIQVAIFGLYAKRKMDKAARKKRQQDAEFDMEKFIEQRDNKQSNQSLDIEAQLDTEDKLNTK